MSVIWWKICYTAEMVRRTGMTVSEAWGCTEAAWENGNLVMTPKEVVNEELSHWGE